MMVIIMLWWWIDHLFASLLSWWVQVSKFDTHISWQPLFSFGPVAFVLSPCATHQAAGADEASFRVRHDSRLDFNSSFIEPEKKKRYIPEPFRRTIVLPPCWDQMVSHVCAGRTQLPMAPNLLVWSCPWVERICSCARQDWTTRMVSLCCLTSVKS